MVITVLPTVPSSQPSPSPQTHTCRFLQAFLGAGSDKLKWQMESSGLSYWDGQKYSSFGYFSMLFSKLQDRPHLYTVQTDMSLSSYRGMIFVFFGQISGCFWCLWSARFWSQYCPSNWPVWSIYTNTQLKISQPHHLCGIVQAKANNKTLNFPCGSFFLSPFPLSTSCVDTTAEELPFWAGGKKEKHIHTNSIQAFVWSCSLPPVSKSPTP